MPRLVILFFFSSRRRHTRLTCDWSSDVCSSDLDQVLLHDLVVTSAAVANASSRLAKIGELATLLRRLSPEEVEIAIAFLSGEPRQGRIGIGPSAIRDARPLAGAASPALQLIEVDEVFGRIAATAGRSS